MGDRVLPGVIKAISTSPEAANFFVCAKNFVISRKNKT